MARRVKVSARNDARYRTLVENSPDPTWVARDGIILYVNAAAVALLGAPAASALVGTAALDRVHPSFHAMALARRQSIVDGAAVAPRDEMQFVRMDGTVVDVDVAATAIVYDDGAPAIHVVIRDRSAQKRAEQALRASEARYRALFEQAGDYALVLEIVPNAAPLIREVNAAALRVFGYTRDELVGQPISILEPDLSAETIRRRRQQFLDGHSVVIARHQRKDGTSFDAEIKATEIEVDGTRFSLVTERDITERSAAHDALRRRTGELATLFEVSKSLSATLDLQTIMQTATDRIAELTDLKRVAFYMVSGETLRLWATTPPLPPDFPEALRLAPLADHPHIREAITTAKPVFLPDTATADLTPAEHAVTVLRGLRSILYLPLVAGSDVFGVLIVSSVDEGHVISAADMELCQTLANVAAMATVNGQLYEASRARGIALEQEIGEHQRTEAALRESARRLSDITFSMGDWVWEVDEEVRYTYSSAKGDDLFGDVLGKTPFDFMPPREAERVKAIFDELAARRAPIEDLENWNRTANGELLCLLTNGVPIVDASGTFRGYRGVDKDITDRKRAEQEKARLNAQLQQAQKMESVGRLAGGVAHDFNNMLGVILGNVELALAQVDAEHPLRADLDEIRGATLRSVELTRQLLAFARKQTVSPKVLDLNETVAGMLKMLQRLIGEDIDIRWSPADGLWPIKIDPSQVDQIMANLCVNARDAISETGKLTIETGHRVFTMQECAQRPEFMPGEYVMLAVSDDGAGMDAETLSHLFEPFFTTKSQGKGTGLGLATVYGIVKQNGGFIDVYSEPAHGTTFKIYLPRHTGRPMREPVTDPLRVAQRGHETLLVAEDEAGILALTVRLLEAQGYTILRAGTPGEAIRVASEHRGDIHLLITDVVMPEMNGRELAKRLQSIHPRMKCLFMSGYTADVIAHRGALDEGVHFIQKPFTQETLTQGVRDALDRALDG